MNEVDELIEEIPILRLIPVNDTVTVLTTPDQLHCLVSFYSPLYPTAAAAAATWPPQL